MTENVETEVAHFSGKMNGFKGGGEREREVRRQTKCPEGGISVISVSLVVGAFVS